MQSILTITDKCSGCTACKASCLTSSITMEMDSEGFYFPQINSSTCVSCGRCDKVCPTLNPKQVESNKTAYYGWHKDEKVRNQSSSGGAFAAIAYTIIENGGIVYGAVFDADRKRVVHKGTDSVKLSALQKSKYVESNSLDTLRNVKANLEQGRKVLYCGTPCQIHGLKSFLGKDSNNLITCDFVCHGIPSGGKFKEHLCHLEKVYKYPIIDVDFRPKDTGWATIYIKIVTTNTTITKPYSYDSFYKGFMTENIILRRSCYSCNYANNHASDITLADFWGYKKFDPNLDDGKGISLIITNSLKGENTLQKIKTSFELHELDMKYADYIFVKRDYTQLIEKRNRFFTLAHEIGFEKAASRTYFKNNKYHYTKYKVKKFIKKLIY